MSTVSQVLLFPLVCANGWRSTEVYGISIRGFTQFVLLIFLPSVLQVLLLQLILVQFVVKKKLILGFLPNWCKFIANQSDTNQNRDSCNSDKALHYTRAIRYESKNKCFSNSYREGEEFYRTICIMNCTILTSMQQDHNSWRDNSKT